MKNSWFTGLLFSLLLSACTTVEAPPQGEPTPEAAVVEVLPPVTAPEPEVTPAPATPPPVLDPGVFALYRITTDPPGVGVLREGGELIGLTPLSIRLESSRAFRLTFLKKGYSIVGKYIKPEPGNQVYHLVMVPEE